LIPHSNKLCLSKNHQSQLEESRLTFKAAHITCAQLPSNDIINNNHEQCRKNAERDSSATKEFFIQMSCFALCTASP
jgi:hypothetical protein